jgi:hypothetical protein
MPPTAWRLSCFFPRPQAKERLDWCAFLLRAAATPTAPSAPSSSSSSTGGSSSSKALAKLVVLVSDPEAPPATGLVGPAPDSALGTYLREAGLRWIVADQLPPAHHHSHHSQQDSTHGLVGSSAASATRQ